MKFQFLILIILLCMSCTETNPNLNRAGEDVLHVKEVFIDPVELTHQDTVYIPVYSDIYSKSKNDRFLLTATLSIRNTSPADSIFVEEINYYDSHGDLVRSYIDRTLLLKPMQSIEYVIEEDDTSGGTGANFLVRWGARRSDLIPIFQGVMISTHGQQGISFITDGISISRRE